MLLPCIVVVVLHFVTILRTKMIDSKTDLNNLSLSYVVIWINNIQFQEDLCCFIDTYELDIIENIYQHFIIITKHPLIY